MRQLWFFGAGVCPMVVAALLVCATEQCLAQDLGKAAKEERTVVHGEVVEVTGDKVRVALKGNRGPQVGDPVKITYEIAGTDIKADVAKGKVDKVELGFASVDITDKSAEIRKGYLAEITTNGSSGPAVVKKEGIDLSGQWLAQSGDREAVWVLKRRGDGRYDAEQNAPGYYSSGCRGEAEFSNGKLQIRWAQKGLKGSFEWQLDATHTKAHGKHEIDTPDGLKTFDVKLIRVSENSVDREKKDVADKTGTTRAANDFSGRWRESAGAKPPVWTLKRRTDGKYEVRQDVAGHPSTGCEGTAEFANGTLSILWVQNTLKNKGGGDWRIDSTQTKANASHFIFSFTGKDDRNYECTLTRLTDNQAPNLELKEAK